MSDLHYKNDDEIDLLDLVAVLLKNIKIIIGITLLFIVAVVGFSVVSLLLPPEKSPLPNEFSPNSYVLINSSSGSSGGLSSLLGGDSGLGSLASLAGVGSSAEASDSMLAIKLVTTNSFIQKIDNQFNLHSVYELEESEQPKTDLKNIVNQKLKIEEDADTGMLEISYTDINKVLATDIVNKVTELLEEEFAKIDSIRNNNQFDLVNEKISVMEQDINNLQNQIIEFQAKNNMMDVDAVSKALVSQLSNFQSQLLAKEVEIESYGSVSNVRDPNYVKLLNEKEAIEKAIDKVENGGVGNYPPMSKLPELALQLTKLQQEAEIKAQAYAALVAQSESLKLTASGTGSTFQVLEYAEIPEVKSGPSRGKLCIIVTFAGFFFSIFFVFIKEAINNIKNDPEKMKRLRGEA